jgi:hypothetical protein
LQLGQTQTVAAVVWPQFRSHVAGIWESLARESVPFLGLGGLAWGAASRWWGSGTDGKPLEFDVVAESLDRAALLVGEAKWGSSPMDATRAMAALRDRATRLPIVRGRRVVLAMWLKEIVPSRPDLLVLNPGNVLDALM